MALEEYQKLEQEGQYKLERDMPTVEFKYIGRRGIPRLDGYRKASGQAIYTRDIVLPGMLYAKTLKCPYARARIKKLDTTKAESLPGVRAILRYDDPEVYGKKLNGCYFGPEWVCPEFSGFALKPVHLVLGDTGYFEGDPIGVAVCAESEDICEEALKLVDVEWEPLPFVLDQEEALKPDAPILRPGADSNELPSLWGRKFEKGCVEEGFKEADVIIDFKAKRNPHVWVGVECASVVVRWNGDILEMWVHEQQPYIAKMLIAEWFGIPMSKVIVHSLYQGGSFGERGNTGNSSENGINIIAAILSKRTGKPVKLTYDRRENFYGESGDMMVSYVKVGAKKDGTITAVQMKNVYGVYACTRGVDHFIENTKIPNLSAEVIVADVSKGPAWWCRCEQLPNTMLLTLVFDHVAAALGLDPTEVALKNDGCDGHDTAWLREYKLKHGFPDRDSLRECIEAGKKAIGWNERWHPPGTKKLPNGKMHGIAFTWTHEWDDVRGTGSAAVMIESDGSVSIIAQHADIGLNDETTYCQIVADELGVRLEDVSLNKFDSNVGLELMSPDGSCNLCSNALVIRKAAAKAKKMLLELAAQQFRVKPEELDVKDSVIYVKTAPDKRKTIKEVMGEAKAMPMHVSCVFWTRPPIIAWAWHTQGLWGEALETGRPRFCRQAHFMEVEVDPETGEIEVTRVVNVNDVGKVISYEGCEGQQYGGTYMGVSRALFEELIYDPSTGVKLNANLLDYKVATILDVRQVDTVLLETGLGWGPYGTCGIAEDVATVIPALLSPAVYNAIGVWIDDFPITPDKVLKALKEKGVFS
jgi:xanthine dehydrogenase molybdenum-binding subunit